MPYDWGDDGDDDDDDDDAEWQAYFSDGLNPSPCRCWKSIEQCSKPQLADDSISGIYSTPNIIQKGTWWRPSLIDNAKVKLEHREQPMPKRLQLERLAGAVATFSLVGWWLVWFNMNFRGFEDHKSVDIDG